MNLYKKIDGSGNVYLQSDFFIESQFENGMSGKTFYYPVIDGDYATAEAKILENVKKEQTISGKATDVPSKDSEIYKTKVEIK